MPTSFGGVDLLNLRELSYRDVEAYGVDFCYHGRRFSVLITSARRPEEGCDIDDDDDDDDDDDAVELSWIDRLWDLSSHSGGDPARVRGQALGQLEIAREIRDAVFPMLERLAPTPPSPSPSMPAPAAPPGASDPVRPGSVEEHLFPPCIRLELVTRNGRLEVLSGHREEADRIRLVVPWAALREIGLDPGSVPTFAAQDVSIVGDRIAAAADAFDVSVPGLDSQVVGKLVSPMDESQRSLKREMEIYAKLQTLGLDREARVPELKGLITSGEGVVGFIMTKVAVRHPSLQPMIPGDADDHLGPDSSLLPALSLRKKWVGQVEHTVEELHRHGIVWGDAKPDNVVVDVEDNAWVIDFGGGGTPGWMEMSMVGTEEGDLYAIAKMKDKLRQLEQAER